MNRYTILSVAVIVAFVASIIIAASTQAAFQRQSSAQDRAALVALYNATNGPNWTNTENWLTEQPIGTWHGVTADSDHFVIRLELHNNGLNGPLPSDITDFARIEHLATR